MQKEDDTKFFTVKYYGQENPLKINLPQNTFTGQKYIEVEIGSFFYSSFQKKENGNTKPYYPLSVPPTMCPIDIYIPGAPSEILDKNGVSTQIATRIAPYDAEILSYTQNEANYMLQYKYSPGRPDIQFLPPCSTFEIQIYEHYNKEVYNNPN
jgi:hypothetical protein